MSEQTVTIPTSDGQAPAKLFLPEGADHALPGVLYLTDIWGIRPANEKMACRVADQGYAVLMPHLFYRTQPMTFDPLLHGRPRDMAVIGPLLASLPPKKMTADGLAYIDYLLARPEVTGGQIAVVGYCFSGAMAVRIAAAGGKRIAAAASFHGGRLVTEAPDSPHLLIPKISAALYFGHAVEDPSMTPAQIETLDETLKAWGGVYQSEIYQGAKHGWAVEGRPEIYNPAQAERHFVKLFDLLARTFK